MIASKGKGKAARAGPSVGKNTEHMSMSSLTSAKASRHIVTPVNQHQVPNKDLKAIVPLTTELESEFKVLIQEPSLNDDLGGSTPIDMGRDGSPARKYLCSPSNKMVGDALSKLLFRQHKSSTGVSSDASPPRKRGPQPHQDICVEPKPQKLSHLGRIMTMDQFSTIAPSLQQTWSPGG
ncbi:hypothetical protein PGT21_017665 [Puccinia graminis f. sp. tritici]|uniref:Uncharacterized protein n=2 Tax=Puccinia graminis f. sp. tritici TaxID=56615 RepID=E3KEW8_PUCGT|nr:uncharacterized protein PGTG_09800 [Puccinia graminis f. sp. tritici CRL 75-36-700-3]EFP82832.2 hypothetical protein PGTG_09800 [Puccinia graminis f. sp. tritici CRL 75-36-700-3]KAA1069241.1 hypothetical protein PGT21_017665 [Puccinia graminis f. sp. tritici]KAA1075601.1 hypothetical protein PGTUg99_030439 [Puccinia graminis f. sp. tritici]